MGISLIADTTEDAGNSSRVEKELEQAVSLAKQPLVKSEETPDDKVEQTQDEVLPTKLRGKTAAEIAEMYVNLESTLGRMANDLGTQRKMTDQLLGLKREQDLQSQTPPSKLSREDLIATDDPTPALDKFVATRLSRVETETQERLQRMEQSLAQSTFVAKHPDYSQVANDPSFVAWVQATPFRQRVAQAVMQGDWSAADELLSEWKAVKPASGKQSQQQDDGVAAARKASLESTSNSGKGPGDKQGKTYRRADLIKLRVENPEAYYADDFQSEIMRAYAEKRVV